jgi:hypothetical protein
VRTPTWSEVRDFLAKDGWERTTNTDHSHYRKVLADSTILETHISFSGQKTMSPGRFALILRTQIKVDQTDFWETIGTGRPAVRPAAELPEAPSTLPEWMVRVLVDQMRKRPEDIARLDRETAQAAIDEFWSHSGEQGS